MELVGLSMSALTWLEKLAAQKVYPYDGVSAIKNGRLHVFMHDLSKGVPHVYMYMNIHFKFCIK